MVKLHRLGIAGIASLVPWLALLVAAEMADEGPASVGAPPASVLYLYLAFVALPCLLPLAAARAALTRLAVLVVLTVVAAYAGWQMATIEDGQAGLAVLLVPYVAVPLGVVLWTVEVIAAHRRAGAGDGGVTTAGVSERLAALIVDVVITGAVLVAPLTMLSHAGMEVVAGLIGVVTGAVYMAGLLGPQGRTIGRFVLGLTVVDRVTMAPLAPGRALLRGLVLVLELVAGPTFLVVVPVAELLSAHATGRSLTDRVLHTAVVTGAGR